MKYRHDDLRAFAEAALAKAGLGGDKGACVAEVLVEGDLLGHSTHGLALLPSYAGALKDGTMTASGSWEVISDGGACHCWDGRRLPGPWLVVQGIQQGVAAAKAHGSYILAIRNSHHIACLAAYLKAATDQGLFVLLSSSDPAAFSVAALGGTKRLYSPNPIAAGIPTEGDPILLDVSMLTTTNGLTARSYKEGKRLPHAWILDSQGRATDDPAAYFEDPGSSILPLGGLDSGHKGFALGLLVEAMTSALAGGGRSQNVTQWGASVFLMLLDPEKFGGSLPFLRETAHLVGAAKASPALDPDRPIRIPGERGLSLRSEQLQSGVSLSAFVEKGLHELAADAGLQFPQAC